MAGKKVEPEANSKDVMPDGDFTDVTGEPSLDQRDAKPADAPAATAEAPAAPAQAPSITNPDAEPPDPAGAQQTLGAVPPPAKPKR